MKKNPLIELEKFGQAIWLDYISRDLITSGKLKQMINEEGLQGMTSNPAIFQKAISESRDYDQSIKSRILKGEDIQSIYEGITQEDIKAAADEFRTIYEKSDGIDGYVSLEVNPHLAHDTKGTIEEARRLWKSVNRPNVFIKVPATLAGIPAIEQLISEGININVTLLFGLPRYRQVAEAYIAGIEKRISQNLPVDHIASVASFFLSRIDVIVDEIVKKMKDETLAKKIMGETAIASAKLAYQIYKEIFHSERFEKLAEKGARVQRLLWASTGTKNPNYSDIKYIEPLIAPLTINTVPLETLEAYRDHGNPKVRIEEDVKKAEQVFLLLPKVGIDIDEITQKLEDEGVDKFNKPFDQLMETLKNYERKR